MDDEAIEGVVELDWLVMRPMKLAPSSTSNLATHLVSPHMHHGYTSIYAKLYYASNI